MDPLSLPVVPAGAAAMEAAKVPVAQRPRARVGTTWLLWLGAVALVFLSGLLDAMGLPSGASGLVLALGLLTFGAAGLHGLWMGLRMLTGRVELKALDVLGLLVALPMAVGGFLIGSMALFGFTRGRQLRRLGRPLLPQVGVGGAWAGLELSPEVPAELRAGLAGQWRENGRTEHASVAAFAGLTLELMSLGAPPELLADAQADAADEVRHAQLCFALARALDGRSEGPLPFAGARSAGASIGPRPVRLARLAVDSLIEGALLEGHSARLLAELVPLCGDEATRALLRELAADEGRHSKHGWDVLAWCLEEGGLPVAQALRGAVAAFPERVESTLAAGAHDGGWERFGIPSTGREARTFAEACTHTRRRLDALLAPQQQAA